MTDTATFTPFQPGMPLDTEHLAHDPITQFRRWYRNAEEAKIELPEAMALATVTPDGWPAVRMVLCKSFDETGFVFFTNYHSDKANDLEKQPRVSLLFHWKAQERQVRICGTTQKLSREASEAYFQSRPRGSQVSAWASPQSRVVQDRAELHQLWLDEELRWQEKSIACPPFWGGYLVIPDKIEFWQGQPSRYHDRFRYTRTNQTEGAWTLVRLAP